MSEFDNIAATWDDNPLRNERAQLVADYILQDISEPESKKAFEYGCGTGTLSFYLQPYLDHIVLADNSQGMLNVLDQKIKERSIDNMEPLFLDLQQDDRQELKDYDLLYTMMTLHHVSDYQTVIQKLHQKLRKNGLIYIVDLYPEDGSFHGNEFDTHPGLDPEHLKDLLQTSGFNHVAYQHLLSINKETEEGIVKPFPAFIIKGINQS